MFQFSAQFWNAYKYSCSPLVVILMQLLIVKTVVSSAYVAIKKSFQLFLRMAVWVGISAVQIVLERSN